MVCTDHGTYSVADGRLPISIGGFHQAGQLAKELVVVEGDGLADVDQLVVGLGEALLGHELLFIELLTRTETDVFDLDIHIRLEAGKADHVAGQSIDLHRAAHVEDEDLAPVGIGAGQHDKAHSLGDSHEIADDVRVGHRDGAALLDLLPEDGDHRAVGAQDVAEADCHELGLDIAEDLSRAVLIRACLTQMGKQLRNLGGAAGLDLGVEGLDDHLTETLTGAHDVGGIHGLVGGDEDKALAAVDHGGVGRFIGADGVVLNGLTGAVFHEGDVLVGRGVVDNLGMVLLKDLEDTAAVADGADQGHKVQVRILFPQFQLDGVGVVFIDIEDDELLRMMTGHLAAEFRADASPTACDEDNLAVDEVINFMKVRGDGLTSQKVLDGDILEFRNGDLAGNKLIVPGEHLHLAAGLVADAEDLLSVFPRHAWDGEEDLRDMILLDILEDRLSPTHDGDTLDGTVPFVLVIVDNTDGFVIQLVRGLQVTQEHPSGFPGTDDHDAAAGLPPLPHMGTEEEQEAEEEAQAHHKQHLKHASPDVVRHGHAAINRRNENAVENRSRQGAKNRTGQLFNTGIAPHNAVHVEEVVNHYREDGIPGDKLKVCIQILRFDCRIIAVEAEPQGQEVADMGNGKVIDRREESNDLPMLNMLEILHAAHLLPKVQSIKCKVELIKVKSPGHADDVEALLALGFHFPCAVLLPLVRDPAAELIAVRTDIGRRAGKPPVLSDILRRVGIALFPLKVVPVAPDHAEGVQACDLLFGEPAALGLPCPDPAEPSEPGAQLHAVWIHIGGRDIQVPMGPVILHGGGIVALEEVVQHFPAHAEIIEGLDPLIRQIGIPDAVAAVHTHVGNPVGKLDPVLGHIAPGHPQVPMFIMVLFRRGIIALPAQIRGALPAHAESIQLFDLIRGQGSLDGPLPDLALGVDPLAEGIALRGHIADRDFEIAEFGLISLCHLEHDVPGGGESVVQTVEELQAVVDLIDNGEAFGFNLLPQAEGTVVGNGCFDLFLNGRN